MRPGFAALEPYLAREDPDDAVRTARRAFAGVWLVYDVVDTLAGGLEHAKDWLPHRAGFTLLFTHAILVVCGVQLVRDRRPLVFGLLAAGARLVESSQYGLNDFYYYALMMLLLAHGDGAPWEAPRRPLWVRHALLAQLGWMYLATAALKMNEDWLGGGQLFVRTDYLARTLDWPYPSFVLRALQSMRVCAALAYVGVAAELSLAGVLLARRPFWLGVALAVGIHGFAMFVTNVWFFSVSNVVVISLLLPRHPPRPHHPRVA